MLGVIDEMLQEIGEELVTQLKASISANGRKATGKSGDSLEVVSTAPGQMSIMADPYFTTIETGRKPTPEGTAAGTPTLATALIDWCRARGLDIKLRFAIAKKIHKYGWTGTPGVITSVISDQNINKVIEDKFLIYSNGIINESFSRNQYL